MQRQLAYLSELQPTVIALVRLDPWVDELVLD